jgi:sec-independent protein translocase protein TatC
MMTFGEHLEVLRVHVIRALLGLVLCVVISLVFADRVLAWLQWPLLSAIRTQSPEVADDLKAMMARAAEKKKTDSASVDKAVMSEFQTAFTLQVDVNRLLRELNRQHPDRFPEPAADAKPAMVPVQVPIDSIAALLKLIREDDLKPRTDSIDEAFMVWMKVALAVGIFVSSPWVLYQLWLFVAAGLYPHERSYVYKFLPLSIALFLFGALFCFFAVMPIVISFLWSYNAWLDLRAELKISDYLTWMLMLSLMFGLSFELPLVMLILDRVSIFSVKAYREQRRMAILIIAIVSMVLTPSEPYSMILMMAPLCLLYELGIILCGAGRKASLETQPT